MKHRGGGKKKPDCGVPPPEDIDAALLQQADALGPFVQQECEELRATVFAAIEDLAPEKGATILLALLHPRRSVKSISRILQILRERSPPDVRAYLGTVAKHAEFREQWKGTFVLESNGRQDKAEHDIDRVLEDELEIIRAASPQAAAEMTEQQRILMEALKNALSEKERRAIKLRYSDEMRYEDIAVELALASVASARVVICRARRKLRAYLNHWYPGLGLGFT